MIQIGVKVEVDEGPHSGRTGEVIDETAQEFCVKFTNGAFWIPQSFMHELDGKPKKKSKGGGKKAKPPVDPNTMTADDAPPADPE
jgi:hypothetical protein